MHNNLNLLKSWLSSFSLVIPATKKDFFKASLTFSVKMYPGLIEPADLTHGDHTLSIHWSVLSSSIQAFTCVVAKMPDGIFNFFRGLIVFPSKTTNGGKGSCSATQGGCDTILKIRACCMYLNSLLSPLVNNLVRNQVKKNWCFIHIANIHKDSHYCRGPW